MTKGILGKKVGMTQFFTENGELVPVTVIEATPNVVLQVKTMENDGYEAVQLGFQDLRVKDSKVQSSVMANHVVQWLTVLVTTVVQVRWVGLRSHHASSKVKAFQVKPVANA